MHMKIFLRLASNVDKFFIAPLDVPKGGTLNNLEFKFALIIEEDKMEVRSGRGMDQEEDLGIRVCRARAEERHVTGKHHARPRSKQVR